jgi:hypothetical protein
MGFLITGSSDTGPYSVEATSHNGSRTITVRIQNSSSFIRQTIICDTVLSVEYVLPSGDFTSVMYAETGSDLLKIIIARCSFWLEHPGGTTQEVRKPGSRTKAAPRESDDPE